MVLESGKPVSAFLRPKWGPPGGKAPRQRRFPTRIVVALAAFLAAACHLEKGAQAENFISFDQWYDSLKVYDSVVIVLKKQDGSTLDTVFNDKVGGPASIQKLKAPHWEGGIVVVSVTGITGGSVRYQVDTRFDPATSRRDNTVVFATPDAKLSSTVQGLTLLVGDSLSLPLVTRSPSTLRDTALEWRAEPPGLLEIGQGFIRSLQAGSGTLVASLRSNPTITLTITLAIGTSGQVPQSVTVEPDTLEIPEGAPPRSLSAQVRPIGASSSVEWTSEDPTLAAVDSLGRVSGKRRGETTVWAASQVRPSVRGSARIKVTAPIAVQSVRFDSASLEIFLNGTSPILAVTVLPPDADPAVSFTLSDSTKASIAGGRITGTAVGALQVIAASVSNPGAKDTLDVKVSGPLAVEKVSFARDSLDILVGGAPENVAVTVAPPGANPAVAFTLSDSTKASLANGKITGLAAGRISVVAVSASNPAARDTLIVRIAVPTPNDTTPPGTPKVKVAPAGPTRDMRPVWTWSSGGGGAGSYQIQLDKSVFDSSALAVTDTAFRPAANLGAGSHVLYVRERDAAGNWSLPGTAQVEIDTSGPAAPKIAGTSPTSALPRWTWKSGGGGGAGVYRSRLGDAAFPADAPESQDSAYALATAVSGTTYTLYVQERDAAGNWSPAAGLAIKYDVTKPTVAFLAPLASGTFMTPADTVTVKGTATGPNTITAVEYSLDGGVASPLALGAGGAWTIPSLQVPNAKTTVVKVVATDNLNNKGEASLSILRDSDPPSPPTNLKGPSSPTNVATATFTWAEGGDGTAGSGLNGRYRWRLATNGWIMVVPPTATGVALAEGANSFQVQEDDRAGNWSASATLTVVLDTKPPDAVTFVGVDGSYTDDATPTWSWSPSAVNGGIGSYILKLDAGAEFDGGTATSYTPTTALSDNATHTLTVKEKDQVTGVTGAAKTFSFKVKVNPPGAPVVRSANASLANNGLTNNPGFAWNAGGGGNGKFRLRLNNETTYKFSGAAQTTWSLGAGDADGSYTVRVSEQDSMNRWGAEGTFTIRLDRTAPSFTNAKIVGETFPLREGFITNVPSVTISYTVVGVAGNASRTLSCTLTDNAAKVCKAASAETDSAGNSATFQNTIWRRSNVIFFTTTGAGKADGTSWENARGALADFVSSTSGADIEGKDFWLGSGEYPAVNVQFKWFNMYGGFDAAAYPTDVNTRIKNSSTVASMGFFEANQTVIDGVRLKGLSFMSDAAFRDCQIAGPIEFAISSDVTFTNCELTGVNGGTVPVMPISNSNTVTWVGGKITDNHPVSGVYPIDIEDGGSMTISGAATVSSNGTGSGTTVIQIRNGGVLNIANTVTINCNTILDNGGSGSCKGNPL